MEEQKKDEKMNLEGMNSKLQEVVETISNMAKDEKMPSFLNILVQFNKVDVETARKKDPMLELEQLMGGGKAIGAVENVSALMGRKFSTDDVERIIIELMLQFNIDINDLHRGYMMKKISSMMSKGERKRNPYQA